MAAQALFESLEKINFIPGQILLREGESGFFFYIVQEGKVEVFRTKPDGTDAILGLVGSGQPLGEFALMTQSVRSASARALTAGVAIKVSGEVYQRLLDSLPDWALAIMTALIDRLQNANAAIQRGEHLDFEKTIVDEGLIK